MGLGNIPLSKFTITDLCFFPFFEGKVNYIALLFFPLRDSLFGGCFLHTKFLCLFSYERLMYLKVSVAMYDLFSFINNNLKENEGNGIFTF